MSCSCCWPGLDQCPCRSRMGLANEPPIWPVVQPRLPWGWQCPCCRAVHATSVTPRHCAAPLSAERIAPRPAEDAARPVGEREDLTVAMAAVGWTGEPDPAACIRALAQAAAREHARSEAAEAALAQARQEAERLREAAAEWLAADEAWARVAEAGDDCGPAASWATDAIVRMREVLEASSPAAEATRGAGG